MTSGGARTPGPGKTLGRPPLPAHLKRKKYTTTLTDDEIEIILRFYATGNYKGGGYVIGEALRLLVEAKCHHKK